MPLISYIDEFFRDPKGMLIFFLLAFPGAKIINLDDHSRVVDSWTELKNPRVYYDFFKKHAAEFEET